MAQVAEVVKKDPRRLDVLEGHPALEPVASYPRLRELAEDEELRKALEARHFREALHHPKLLALLTDPEFRARTARIDWQAIRRDIEGKDRKEE